MKIVADSNLIIPSVAEVHPFHDRARAALAEPLQRGELLVLQHVLIESYSVITRSPAPLRVSPAAAYYLLHKTYGGCPIIATSLSDVWQFLRDRNIETAAGRIYDALIAVTAIEAGAQRLLTFNPKHFAPFADQIEIVVPA